MATKYGPTIVTDGLVIYLDAGNSQSYSGSGTTWTDIVSGYNATLSGGATHTQPKTGLSYAITLDGTDDFIVNTTLPGGDTSFTLDFWVYHNGNDQGASFGIYSGGTGYGPLIYDHGSGVANNHYWGGTSYATSGASTVVDDWVNMVWSWDNIVGTGGVETFTSWKNGVFNNSYNNFDFNDNGHGNGNNGYILGGYTATTNPFKGSYGSFRYYNKQLTDAEALQNYNANKGRYGL